ncbi:MAG: type I phosphomannose isomerase catalytic subunit [Aureliella sp.]
MAYNNERGLMHIPPYPLRLEPTYRDYLWGGRRLASRLGKALPAEGIWAESWEVVDHREHESVINNGALAGETLGGVMRRAHRWLVGEAEPVGDRFPLLLKYLDCQRVLSVQVHPDDQYALQMNPPDLGKTEAWYIVHAEPGAVLYAGLKPGIDRESLREAIAAGETAACLHQLQPKAGDCVFIPSGTVHALGAGLIVAEIQQASNTTFRLYDWDRVDAQGNSRALHVEQSLETIDFASGPRGCEPPRTLSQPGRMRLVQCDKFCFDRIAEVDAIEIAGDGRFHILTVPEGRVDLIADEQQITMRTGDSVLLPATLGPVEAILGEGTTLLDATSGI